MKTDKLLQLIQQKRAMRSGGALPLPKAQNAGSTNPLLNIPENIRFQTFVKKPTVEYPAGYWENKTGYKGPAINPYTGEPFATGAIEESMSPLDIIGGVKGGSQLLKGYLKYRKAFEPNLVQLGDELIDLAPHPRQVRRAINQMHQGAREFVLPNAFTQGGTLPKHQSKGVVMNPYMPGVPMATGAAESVMGPIEVALLPSQLPIRAATTLGRGAVLAAEVLNPLSGFRNVYKINPWAFKPNPEAGYRMIGGKEGYLDAITSGQIRPTGAYEHAHFNIGQPLNPNRLSAEELIQAGSPGGYKGPYMAEMQHGTWQRMSDAFPNNPEMQEQFRLLGKDKDVWQHPLFGNIKVDDPRLKLYKEDWLRGYKEVPKSKKINGGLIMNTYQKGGPLKDMVVSDIWEKVTGTKWSEAKKLGLSDGSYETNIKLRQMLINEAMQSKPNFGKFIGQPASKVPASSGIVNQLRQEGLAQAAAQQDQTRVARPIMSPVAPAGSRSISLQPIAMPTNQVAPANTSGVARPIMTPVVGPGQPAATRSVPMEKIVMPSNQVAERSTTVVQPPVMMSVVGRAKPAPKAAAAKENPSMMNMEGLMGTIQAMNILGASAIGDATKGLYDVTVGPEINYLNDPESAVAANAVRGTLGAVGVPLNAANLIGDLVGAGKKMDNRSLNDEEQRILYMAAKNAQERNSPVIQYQDYAGLGYGDDKLFIEDLARGKMSNRTMLKESFTNPAFNVASTIGQSVYEFAPDGTLVIEGSSDWNPKGATFRKDDTVYKKIRNYMRQLNREQVKNMSPEELKELENKNAINLTIPPSILTTKAMGGSKGSMKIKIRKNV